MAIIDKNAHNWIDDSNENQSIGLTLPLLLDNGQIASTKTTLEAVKQNVLNLLNTEMGERVMQPNLGIMLKRFLFEPFSNEVVDNIGSVIVEAMNHWMPFVQINDIRVKMSDNESGDFKSTMEVSVDFSLKKDNSVGESVQITVGE
tara:strand:+ start:43 stop:480 length:438 start_codon:yes stop_codon:yes gene_type:complete